MHYAATYRYDDVPGIGLEPGVCRRDPSDVIRVGDTWYVWYSKTVKAATVPGRHGYPSGYQGDVWWATSDDAGRTWIERGKAAPKGPAGDWDCSGTFSPNIIEWEGRYWLYYTAVGPGHDNEGYSDRNRTAIGVCWSESPDGPWTKASGNPVLTTTRDPDKFDSFRVDDACMLARDCKVWLYYKGRRWEHTPAETMMGVAVADRPDAPFVRLNDGDTVQDSGHEVQIFPHGPGVMSIVSAIGPHGRTLQYAENGVDFRIVGPLPGNHAPAPGLYRPDLTGVLDDNWTPTWGICMTRHADPHLRRYEMTLERNGQ